MHVQLNENVKQVLAPSLSFLKNFINDITLINIKVI